MSDDEESRSTLDRVRDTKREASPDIGYQLAEWDMLKPPTERVGKTSQWWLTLSEVSVPPESEFTEWSVFDQYTNDYVDPKFLDLPEEPAPESVSEAIMAIESGDEKDIRIELVRIRRVADQHPDACEPAISTLVDRLSSGDIAVQAEIIGILHELSGEDPELVRPTIETLSGFLDIETHDRLRKGTVAILSCVAEEDPAVVSDLVPKLEVLLKETTDDTGSTQQILTRVAAEYPEAVLPIVPTLVEHVSDPSHTHRVGTLSVLGQISKPYPNVATDVVPTAHELLSVEKDRLRANAAALLADLAGEYPAEVQSTVPDAIELLSDEDDHARYNATSILARVAEHDPEPVRPAIEALIDALDEDRPAARENACWALGHLEATRAREALATCAESDPNERVRQAASWALDKIESS